MNALKFLLPGLTLLAGCQSNTEKQPAQGAPSERPSPGTVALAPLRAPDSTTAEHSASFTGFRRYRGTIGNQAITLELTFDRGTDPTGPVKCQGSYTYDRHPAGLLLLKGPSPYRPGQPLYLTEADSARPGVVTGSWQATQPAGLVLTGTWRSPAGKALPFQLREDYTDGQGHRMAVSFEVLSETVTGPPCRPERDEGESVADYRARIKDLPPASLDRQVVHLLGPDTLEPALRHLQCPLPARRRRTMRNDLREAGDCAFVTDGVDVTYLGHGLLATHEYHELYYQGTAHPNHDVDAAVYDLRTGRALSLAEVLRPGTDPALRRLITPALQQEMKANGFTDPEVLAPAEGDTATTRLPATGFGLSEEGLTFEYTDNELGAYAYGMPMVTIPWAALQPLLRPSSPVARMLRDRGLWHRPTGK